MGVSRNLFFVDICFRGKNKSEGISFAALEIPHLCTRVHRDHVTKHIFRINDDSSAQLLGQSFQIPMLARIGKLYFP